MENIYHACRVAFICGEENVPWHMVCHALRQGLNMRHCMTYELKEKDFEQYPQLRELVKHLGQTGFDSDPSRTAERGSSNGESA